ncbi:MAG: branched-chain amino acid ABC transporter permease [Hoeflea sp. D1-CHI-28]
MLSSGQLKYVTITIFALLALFPPMTAAMDNAYLVPGISRILIYAVAAISLNLLVGYVGLVSLGHAAYLGIGGYVVAILSAHAAEGSTIFGLPGTVQALFSVPLAVLISGVVALVLGALSLRTSGIYFIMISLAFGQMVFFFTVSLERYGGDDGLFMYAGPNRLAWLDLSNEWLFFYLCLIVLVGFWLFCRHLVGSRLGRALGAIRQNEARMITLGCNTYLHKLAIYGIAGAGAGLAGALLANQASYVSPDLHHWTRSGELLFMVILGGTGTLGGPLLGAAAFLLMEEYLPVIFDALGLELLSEHWRIVFGPLLIIVMLFNRRGIYGLLARREDQ